MDIVICCADALVTLMRPAPIADFVISGHARFDMERRSIPDEVVQQILASPEQRFRVREGRVVLDSRLMMGTPAKMYLVRGEL